MQASDHRGTRMSRIGQSHWLLPAVLALIGALYLATLSANHTESEDSLWYLITISTGRFAEQFHPNHLLYFPVNYIFFHAWQQVGYTGTVELPVKVLNVAAALVALGLVYAFANLLRLPRRLRYFALLGTAFTYGFWWYTVECETYIVPISFILLTLHRLLLIRRDPLNLTHHALLGLFTAAAILFHQQHALLALVVLIGYGAILIERRRKPLERRFLVGILVWGAVCAGGVATIYLLVAVLAGQLTTPAEIARWLTFNARPGGYGYGLSLSSLKGAVGAGRALVGGLFVFSFPALAGFIQRAIPNYDLREELFLVRDFPRAEGLLLAGLSLVLVALVGLAVVALLRQRRATPAARPESAARGFALRLLLAYLALYTVFNLWWQPENLEVWISMIPVAFLTFGLLAVSLGERRGVQAGLGLFLAALFAVNLFGSVLPQHDLTHDYWYTYNTWLIQNATSADLVISGEDGIGDGYIEWYSGSKVLATASSPDPEAQLEWMVRRYQPRRIFVSSSLLSTREQRGQLLRDIGPGKAFFAKIKPDLTLVHSDEWQQIYLYRPVTSQ